MSIRPAELSAIPSQKWAVGVLMLDTGFQRFARDIGNAKSLPFSTLQETVSEAYVKRVVTGAALPETLIKAFTAAGESLVDKGANLITTSCGFLYSAQHRLAASLSVPVVTSSLIALPQLQARCLGSGPVGILTFDAVALSRQLANTTNVTTSSLRVVGVEPHSHFADVIYERAQADTRKLEHDVVTLSEQLVAKRCSAVVLECTNMAPWRHIVERICQVPVIDLIDVIERVRISGPSAYEL